VPNKLNSEQQIILHAIVEVVFGVSEDGTITFCNDALPRMTGYSSEEIVGKPTSCSTAAGQKEGIIRGRRCRNWRRSITTAIVSACACP